MNRIPNILHAAALLLILAGCVYDFEPDVSKLEEMDVNIVVIEGDIVAGGITTVRIGYTRPFYGGAYTGGFFPGLSSSYNPEAGNLDSWKSSVWVEGEDGRIWNGEPSGLGYYKVDTRELDLAGAYRLCVSIPSRGEYRSEFRKVLVTPKIEGLSYNVPQDSTCVHIEVSTRGNGGGAGYYRWVYEEAWNNRPDIMPSLVYSPQEGMSYLSGEQKARLENCYRVEGSTDIIIANTEKLQQDVISGNRIATIAATDKRISREYCITATQYLMDKEGYTYWESMKKNTSGTGGLFAPQPSEVRGNIVSALDPDEVVIGYVNVSTASTESIFITARELGIYDKMNCSNSMTYYRQALWGDAYTKYGMRPVRYLQSESGHDIINEAHWAPASCVQPDNCVGKPDYWPVYQEL